MSAARNLRRRGSPLAMLAVLLGSWVAARAATWETPLALPDITLAASDGVLFADSDSDYSPTRESRNAPAPQSIAYPHLQDYPQYAPAETYQYAGDAYPGDAYNARRAYPSNGYYPANAAFNGGYAAPRPARSGFRRAAYRELPYDAYQRPAPMGYADRRPARSSARFLEDRDLSSAHQRLMREAFGVDWHSSGVRTGAALAPKQGDKRVRSGREVAPPPFAAQPIATKRPSVDRWSLDVFGFYRQGSNALSVNQGRNPIYGASQIGANLQWRARPSSPHDPRVYARAYHALVSGGETEIAAGASALPVPAVPIRVYGEARLTRNPPDAEAGLPERYDFRPAAYAATEIPPQKLPLGFSLEAYAAGGYVGGDVDTYFLDGQAALTQRLATIRNRRGPSSAALSLGGGVWGGAQRDASRVDVGPTVRLDVNIGEVPARFSVDYREQVAGDAEPDSGVAATVSTRF